MSTTGNMYDGNFIGEVGRAAATALAAAAPAAYPSGDIYDRQLISKLGQSFAKAIDDAGGLGGGGGGGGSANWGGIGGTLADQTDLATALSAKIEIGLDGKLPTADGSNLTAVRDGTAVHWRGDFLSGATYAANDIAVLDGVPYLCLTPGAYGGIAVGSDWAKLVPLLPLMDTGWSASVSGSNKTDALPTYTSTNFDSVDSGLTALSAQVAFLTTRVAALQEAMRDGLRPNA